MIRCKRCLIPDTRPDTAFVDGVCSACLSHDKMMEIDWNRRRRDLIALFERQKPNATGFDCIVASSGGKDSHAQVKAVLDLGMRPLIVTATTCMLTPMGRYNIDNLKRYAPTIEVTPNQEVRRKLNKLGLTLVGDISWPEHVAIFTVPLRMAVALNIPLVFYGENPQATYGGPLGTDEAREMTRRWVSEFGGFLGLRPVDMVGQEGITERDMLEYQFPDDKALKKAGIEAHFLGQYLGPWDSRMNAKIAIEMGMKCQYPCRDNWWDFENLDNAMTGIHDFSMLRKYGYGRAAAQMSVDIRWGRLTRDDALSDLSRHESKSPPTYMGVMPHEIANHIGLTIAEMNHIIDSFTVHHAS